jgi:hypothetical protein
MWTLDIRRTLHSWEERRWNHERHGVVQCSLSRQSRFRHVLRRKRLSSILVLGRHRHRTIRCRSIGSTHRSSHHCRRHQPHFSNVPPPSIRRIDGAQHHHRHPTTLPATLSQPTTDSTRPGSTATKRRKKTKTVDWAGTRTTSVREAKHRGLNRGWVGRARRRSWLRTNQCRGVIPTSGRTRCPSLGETRKFRSMPHCPKINCWTYLASPRPRVHRQSSPSRLRLRLEAKNRATHRRSSLRRRQSTP